MIFPAFLKKGKKKKFSVFSDRRSGRFDREAAANRSFRLGRADAGNRVVLTVEDSTFAVGEKLKRKTGRLFPEA